MDFMVDLVVTDFPLNVVLKEMGRQPYQNMALSAGLVEGHPVDTIYLELARGTEEPTTILLRRDEALAIIQLLAGALWSESLEPTSTFHDGYEFCKVCGTAIGAD